MSKGSGAPTKFIASLQTWLKASFGKRFKSLGNCLDHVVQDDTYSCGIITANTIAHAILDRPLCHSKYAAEERLKWFMRPASLYQAKSASTSSGEDVDMPLAALEDTPHMPTQPHKALAIANLLNPIGGEPSEFSPALGYDSDGSSDSEDIPNIPLRPLQKEVASVFEPGSNSRKRLKPDSSTDSEAESSDGYESSTVSISSTEEKRKTKYVKAGEGTSRSAKASRTRREKLLDGTLTIEPWRINVWKKKVLKDDLKAEFDPKNVRHARHSRCGKYIKMKDPCDIGCWKDHIETCNERKSKRPAGGTPRLFQMDWLKVTVEKKIDDESDDGSQGGSEPELKKVPCPGITVSDDPRVLQYLKRTGASGGGGRSLAVIAKQVYKKLFSQLSKKTNKKVVVDKQMQEWKWKNDHVNHRVYATLCQQTVVDRSPKLPHPCTECSVVLRSRAFKNAVRRPIPSDKTSKFVNYRFRNPLLGSIYACTIGVREIVEEEVLF